MKTIDNLKMSSLCVLLAVAPAAANTKNEQNVLDILSGGKMRQTEAVPQHAPSSNNKSATEPDAVMPKEKDAGSASALSETGDHSDTSPQSVQGKNTKASPSGALSETGASQVMVADGKMTAPERLLSRPGASLYKEPDTSTEKSSEYLPNYSILTVVEKKDGWAKVALKAGGEAKGWLQDEQALPWKHQMVVQFAPPVGRNRVLFFTDRDAALKFAALPATERAAKLKEINEEIQKNGTLKEESVVACEPEGWAEMQNNFYLMPIVDFDRESAKIGDEEVLPIQIAAATENTANATNQQDTTGMTLDLVFVMDLSRSMGPIKDQVLDSIRKITEAIRVNPEFKPDTVHFGFWGYRDDTNVCKGIEFVTKDYTTDGLLQAADFISVLEKAEATPVDSIDYAEDVLAGVHDAIAQTKWRPGSARVILLMGDAPGREPGQTDPFSARKDKPIGTAANMGVDELAALANDKGIDLGTVYINVDKYKEHLPIARKQFEGLASKTDTLSAMVVTVNQAEEFDRFSRDVVTMLAGQVKQAAAGASEIKPVSDGQQLATALFRNAKVRWLGRHHEVGVTPDMRGWILDRDLENPVMPTVSRCVLLNRQQLDELQLMLRNVIDAGETAKLTSTDFLQALKTVVVASAKDPDMLKDIRSLADSQFIPSFLKDLPYQSRVMQMSDERWKMLVGDGQDQMLQSFKNKLKYYESLYKDGDVWLPLDDNDDKALYVTPVPLDQLP